MAGAPHPDFQEPVAGAFDRVAAINDMREADALPELPVRYRYHHLTFSTGTPMASVAICAMAVWVPRPTSGPRHGARQLLDLHAAAKPTVAAILLITSEPMF
jgi:hypothetical protein